MLGKLISFLQEAREEVRRVVWPTRRATVKMVLTVIFLSLLVAAFLGALDFLFIYLLDKIII